MTTYLFHWSSSKFLMSFLWRWNKTLQGQNEKIGFLIFDGLRIFVYLFMESGCGTKVLTVHQNNIA